jgi:hypothetical protein
MRAGVFLGGCFAFVAGVLFYNGCGGRIIQAECKPGWQFCAQAVVCCPDFTVCGTGQTNAQGLTCKLGDCCPQLDAGDASDDEQDWWNAYDVDNSGPYDPPSGFGQPQRPTPTPASHM